MGALALAEFESGFANPIVIRDFPFAEEATRLGQFSALQYVRLEDGRETVVLAHGGTQQFFQETRGGKLTLRNMVARETLKGRYNWRWSLTSGRALGPADALAFAQTVPDSAATLQRTAPRSISLANSSNRAVCVFHAQAEEGGMSLWISNFSSHPQSCSLQLNTAFRSARGEDFEGNPLPGIAALSAWGREVRLKLKPWEAFSLRLR
jgi:hypothetical protein